MRFSFTYQNGTDLEIYLAIEPWGGGFYLSPKDVANIEAEAEAAGSLVIQEQGNGVCSLWFWRGCTVQIKIDGSAQDVHYFDVPAPG